MKTKLVCLCVLALALPATTTAQDTTNNQHTADMNHDAMSHQMTMSTPQQSGQSAFAAIQEIVDILLSDPATDWGRVDIDALRSHLIDMDNVTLRAQVKTAELDNGTLYTATSLDSAVSASIQNMVLAHASTMDGVNGWTLTADQIDTGATLMVEGPEADTDRIRALGFIGLMTVGMHHQAHHIAIASGSNPHDH
ncbi:MAG: hypothetical protein V3U76_04535 [Granulosicoccus sp.]